MSSDKISVALFTKCKFGSKIVERIVEDLNAQVAVTTTYIRHERAEETSGLSRKRITHVYINILYIV